MLGHVLSLNFGTSYETAVTQRKCGVLGMSDTAITLSPDQENRKATAHTPRGNSTGRWDFRALEGCGALRSTISDFLRFPQACIGAVHSPLCEAISSCAAPRYPTGANAEVGLG